jgi:hypothetical protein
MLFSQTIDHINTEIHDIDRQIAILLAQIEAQKQRKTQLFELDALTDHTLEGLADVVSKIQCSAPDAIASLKTAVLKLFGTEDGNDGGNQPTEPTPDNDPTPRAEEPKTSNSSDFAELPQSFSPGSTLVDQNGSLGIVIGINNVGMSVDWLGLGSCPNPASGKGIWYNWAKDSQAIAKRCCEAQIASFKPAAHDQVKLLSTLEFLQLQGWEDEQLEEHWDNEWFDVGVGCQCKWGGATINRWIVVFEFACEWASPLATPTASLVWEDAPLLGQACTVEVFQAQPEKTTYTEFVKVSDRIGYIKVNTTGEILATYAGFNNKARAKNWASYLETMTSKIELRAAHRLGDWKHELKISGLSIKQIERLAAENLDKMPPAKEPSLPRTYKPQPIPQPVNPDKVEPGDIVTALLTPSASYKIIQVMPNGILDCENLTTGDRLGLRPGAVSLVQKAEKPQDPEQQALLLEPKPDAPTKYARVKLKGDKFHGQVFAVVKGNELGSTLLTPNGHHWFHADCLEFLDPDSQTTTGNYKGLSKQMQQHWEKLGINPSDLIADMKANRPTEPEWNAAKYNPVLAAVGAGDDLDF